MAHLEGGFLGSTSPKMKPSLPYKHKMHENRLKTNEIQRQIKLIVIFSSYIFHLSEGFRIRAKDINEDIRIRECGRHEFQYKLFVKEL